jgi:hypothetical protein
MKFTFKAPKIDKIEKDFSETRFQEGCFPPKRETLRTMNDLTCLKIASRKIVAFPGCRLWVSRKNIQFLAKLA